MKIWPTLILLSLAGCSSHFEQSAIVSAPHSETSKLARPTPTSVITAVSPPTPATPPVETSHTPAPNGNAVLQTIRKLQTADPAADLEQAWQSGDYKFAALESNGLYVPGVKSNRVPSIMKQYGVKLICEVPDYNRTEEQDQLWPIAISYARRYNSLLLTKLKGG